ncbi:MAG TPA: hypothetical protein VM096_01070 [Vicinamibacterales bacterium]|nr:hypothetical protein [Vicinamibacterales bacterium]
MKLLMPIGLVLAVIGMAGSAASCFGTELYDGRGDDTTVAQLNGADESPANQSKDSTPRLFLAPLAGLTMAIGLVCLAVGMNDWRRSVTRTPDVRPANPWSDQPSEHGDPPKGAGVT